MTALASESPTTTAVVHLTAYQREFIAKRALKGIESARINRARIATKYPDSADATVAMDHVIHQLHDLLHKLGVGTDDVPEKAGQ